MDFPGRSSQPQRAASLSRFRQKRKERCFDKKVRYGVRQEVAFRFGDEHVKLLAVFCFPRCIFFDFDFLCVSWGGERSILYKGVEISP